jgi:hypothetical protein
VSFCFDSSFSKIGLKLNLPHTSQKTVLNPLLGPGLCMFEKDPIPGPGLYENSENTQYQDHDAGMFKS